MYVGPLIYIPIGGLGKPFHGLSPLKRKRKDTHISGERMSLVQARPVMK